MGKRKSYCGKCMKLVKAEGIYCEGSCESWYHPECVSLDASEYDRLSKSSEEWRCEKCNEHEEKLGDNRGNDNCNNTQMEVATTSVEGGNLDGEDGETVTTDHEAAVDAKSEVRKKTIDRTYEVLEGRTVYTEGELESILKENYREERERNEWRDTNVTNTLKSLKGELLGRLNPRESKGMKLNTHTIGQQWPQLEALLIHLVERIEDLESTAAHKQKRIEVLTRKIQLMEEQQKEGQSREVQQDLIQTQPPHIQAPAENQEEQPQNQHVKWAKARKGDEKKQPSENGRVTVENPTERDLIGRPIIRGRRKGSERLRYDTAGQNVEATQRTNMDSKNFKRHRKLDRIRWSKTHNHDVADKLLSQLNTFSQAITNYVRTTAQGRVPTPTGNT